MSTNVNGTAVRLPNGALFAIGPRPPRGPHVARVGYHVLILTADTYQPPASDFPGCRVVRVGVPDDRYRPLSSAQRAALHSAADYAARKLAAGKSVLFTCEMGLNRSSTLAAMTLVRLGAPKRKAIAMVRCMRAGALNNPLLVNVIPG